MPLSPATPRRSVHSRRIELDGFRRDDGLWEFEAHLTDARPYDSRSRWRGTVPAAEAFHEMWLRLTLDDDFVIRGVEAVSDASPFPGCPLGTTAFQKLVGLRVGPGWIKRVRARIRNVEGCTHLMELLRPVATVAYQTLLADDRGLSVSARGEPALVDSCYSWHAEGEAVVAAIYPAWRRAGRE